MTELQASADAYFDGVVERACDVLCRSQWLEDRTLGDLAFDDDEEVRLWRKDHNRIAGDGWRYMFTATASRVHVVDYGSGGREIAFTLTVLLVGDLRERGDLLPFDRTITTDVTIEPIGDGRFVYKVDMRAAGHVEVNPAREWLEFLLLTDGMTLDDYVVLEDALDTTGVPL